MVYALVVRIVDEEAPPTLAKQDIDSPLVVAAICLYNFGPSPGQAPKICYGLN